MALKTARHMDDDDRQPGVSMAFLASPSGDQPHFVRPLAPTHTPQQVCFN